jgi:hypothetical protein
VRKYFGDGATEPRHVTWYLIGRFKRGQQNFLPVAAVTGSGLRIREWVERLLKEKETTGVISGFVFLRKDGKTDRAADFEEALTERLEWIQQNTTGFIPVTIDLWAEFGITRSMRRGATPEVLMRGLTSQPLMPTMDVER